MKRINPLHFYTSQGNTQRDLYGAKFSIEFYWAKGTGQQIYIFLPEPSPLIIFSMRDGVEYHEALR